jgi:hypothetical protein
MEDLVNLYAEKPDPQYPIVLDHLSKLGAGRSTTLARHTRHGGCSSCQEFDYTTRHSRWAHIAQIGICVLRNQCVDRGIGDPKRLVGEIKAWQAWRIDSGARVEWMYTAERAQLKLDRSYPGAPKTRVKTSVTTYWATCFTNRLGGYESNAFVDKSRE